MKPTGMGTLLDIGDMMTASAEKNKIKTKIDIEVPSSSMILVKRNLKTAFEEIDDLNNGMEISNLSKPFC